MHREPRDARPYQLPYKRLRILRSIQYANLNTDANFKLPPHLLHQLCQNPAQQLRRLEQRRAHSARCRKRLRTPRIDIDTGDVGGYDSGSLDGEIGIRCSDLVDEPAFFEFGVDAIDDAFPLFGIEARIQDFRRRKTGEFERVGKGVESPCCPNYCAVDCFRSWRFMLAF